MAGLRLLFLILLLATTTTNAAPYVVCIDPGHGGYDPGAVGCSLEEATVNLQVGQALFDLLTADPDFTPIMTRNSDVFVSLQARSDYANDAGADRFASLHCNSYDGSATGIETYCYTYGSLSSFDQRDWIQHVMTDTWPNLPDRGGKTAGFSVIKYTGMPATLTEMAFIDNCATDATYLASPSRRQEAAEAHHLALRASLGLGDYEGPDIGPSQGVLRGIFFEDQGVGAVDMSIRLPGAKVDILSEDGTALTATADAPNGDWAFSVAPGNWTVTASMAGYLPASRSCMVAAGQQTWCSLGLLPETVDPPTETGTLTGTIYEDQGNGDTSIRLPGAQVTVSGPSGVHSVSAGWPDGVWSFELAPGSYSVTASLAGYELNSRSCYVETDGVTWCSLGLVADPDTPTETTGRVLGVVYENTGLGSQDTSIRIGGASVTASGPGAPASTVAGDIDASFILDLAPGTYTIMASAVGYQTGSKSCVVSVGADSWCSVALIPSPITPPDGEDGRLLGVVYELKAADLTDTSLRLPGANVKASKGGYEVFAVADADNGAWTFALPAGLWQVSASLAGYESAARTCEVAEGQDTWCSIGLPVKPDEPQGRLVGVVYALQDDPEDMTARLMGAFVMATGSGGIEASTVAGAPDALWAMEAAPGTYEVTAWHVGYVTGTRTCAVADGQDSWCSLGLVEQGSGPGPQPEVIVAPDVGAPPDFGGWPETNPGLDSAPGTEWTMPDTGPPGPDANSNRDLGVDSGAGESSPGSDAASASDSSGGGYTFTVGPEPPEGASAGCATGTRPVGAAASLLLFGVALGALLWRRRGSALLLSCLCVVALGCSEAKDPVESSPAIALELTRAPTGLLSEALPAVLVERPLRITGLQSLASDEGLTQPVWSAKEYRLAAASLGFAALHTWSPHDGSWAMVAKGRGVGYEPEWSEDGTRLAHRYAGQRRSDTPALAVDLDGRAAPALSRRRPGSWVRVVDGAIHWREGRSEKRVSPRGDQHCCATRSDDGRWVAFQGVSRGVFVHDLEQSRTWHLGSGTHPRFGGVEGLVFDDCEDDGQQLTSCRVLSVDLSVAPPRVQLVRGLPPQARHPALSPDGRTLAFESRGTIWLGKVE